ncbi:MAG TPA: T9SS type A sorting domain-containing protein [Bacteroidales bacterium]|nr:T9SS type A sorting domain-containing protein [Bacteroidales bacterium]HPJ92250.1 T9SS type A sorting domain-containing protein [Bacteroidales bacterium]
MKILRKITFAVILLELAAIIKLNAQVPMQREVRCSTVTKTYYSVTENTIIDEISDFDLVQLVSNDLHKITEYIINENQLSIIYTYPQLPRYVNDYQYEVGKYIANMYGSTLYDHDNNILYQDLYDELDDSFILSNEEVIEYGNYFNYFNMDPSIAVDNFNQIGFFAEDIGGIVTAVNNEMEIEINFNELTDEFRYYDIENGNVLLFCKKTHYAMSDNATITYLIVEDDTIIITTNNSIIYPIKEIEIHYDTLPKSQIRYQIKEITNYYYYTIIEDGNVLIDVYPEIPEEAEIENSVSISLYQEFEKREVDLKIHPNPATNEIIITLPFYMNQNVDIELMNPLGRVLISKNNFSGDEAKMDISSLTKGIYFIRCKKNNKTVNAKFIKN